MQILEHHRLRQLTTQPADAAQYYNNNNNEMIITIITKLVI